MLKKLAAALTAAVIFAVPVMIANAPAEARVAQVATDNVQANTKAKKKKVVKRKKVKRKKTVKRKKVKRKKVVKRKKAKRMKKAKVKKTKAAPKKKA